MKFYNYGDKNAPVIMLLPGTCCHWSMFSKAASLLKDTFRVICVSYDGFDETQPELTFPSMTIETEKIENYIKENLGGRIFAAYGCSLGGSFAGLLIQRRNIHIDHAFIGSSDMDQAGKAAAKMQADILCPMLTKMLKTGEIPGWMKKLQSRKKKDGGDNSDFLAEFKKMLPEDMSKISEKSIYNQFYSDLVTPIDDNIRADGTVIHVFYALKMGDKYYDRYLQHFPDADICARDLGHEELLMKYPEQWAEEIKRCCGLPFDEEKALPESLSYMRGKRKFFETHEFKHDEASGFDYLDYGNGGKTLVFLIGGMGDPNMVYPYIEAFEKEYRIITFVYPLEIKDMKTLAGGIIKLLDSLGVDKAVFMGSSFGGYMAQLIAAEYPEKTEALCLFSTAAMSEKTIGEFSKKYKTAAPILIKLMGALPYSMLRPIEMKKCMGYLEGVPAETAFYMREMFTDILGAYSTEKDVQMTSLLADIINRKPCTADDLAYLAGKVLLILPEDDSVFSREMQEELISIMTDPETVRISGGHTATLMKSDEYIEAVKKFLGKL